VPTDRGPRYNYYIGSSQGGREALTVAQRYPCRLRRHLGAGPDCRLLVADARAGTDPHSGEAAANWVTPAKVNAIRGEFMRQCDGLDGLADGFINNYMGCRAIFDVKQGKKGRHPWAAKRCPTTSTRTRLIPALPPA
jgi:feruloyl esterase